MLVGTNKHKHPHTRLPKCIDLLRLCLRHYSAVVGLRVCFRHANKENTTATWPCAKQSRKTDGWNDINMFTCWCLSAFRRHCVWHTRVFSIGLHKRKENMLQLFYKGAPYWQTRRPTGLEGRKKKGSGESQKKLTTMVRCVRRLKKTRCPGI